jgi:16S rRNA (adenine1518-N6/adenine1519-N6)-dimethyltransferase
MTTLPNPEKDQHLLIDKEIIKKEIETANLSKKDNVLEIGAGNGILTKELVKKAKRVTSFEIDKRFKEELKELENENPNLKIIYDNALKYDWREYNKIVSNLPYSLSEQTIKKAAEDYIQELILITGENSKKILENKTTKIGIISDIFFDFTPIQKIPKKSFNPPPRVNSWILYLKRKEDEKDENHYLRILLLKKGKIKNGLIQIYRLQGKTKRESKEIIKNLKFPEHILEKPIPRITGNFIEKIKPSILLNN